MDFTAPAVVKLVSSEIPALTLDYVFGSRTSVLPDNIGGAAALVDYVYDGFSGSLGS